MTASRCGICDRPFGTRADDERMADDDMGDLCWRQRHGACLQPHVDWRARALATESLVTASQAAAVTQAQARIEADERAARLEAGHLDFARRLDRVLADWRLNTEETATALVIAVEAELVALGSPSPTQASVDAALAPSGVGVASEVEAAPRTPICGKRDCEKTPSDPDNLYCDEHDKEAP